MNPPPGPWPDGQPAPTYHMRPNFMLTAANPAGKGDFGFGFTYFGTKADSPN